MTLLTQEETHCKLKALPSVCFILSCFYFLCASCYKRRDCRRLQKCKYLLLCHHDGWLLMTVFEAGRDSMRTFQKWRLQGPQLERAPILGRKRRWLRAPLLICWNSGIMFRICVDAMDWMQVKYNSRMLTTVLYTLSRCLNLKMLNEDVWSNLTHIFVAIMESNAAISELTFMSKDKK